MADLIDSQDKERQELIEKMEGAQIILNTINQQRKGALEILERKAEQLSANEDLNMEKLESAVLVNFARELVQSVNSSFLTLEAHDKLIDLIIGDLSASVAQLQSLSGGLLQVGGTSEILVQALLDEKILTRESLEKAHKKISENVKEAVKEAEEKETKETLVTKS